MSVLYKGARGEAGIAGLAPAYHMHMHAFCQCVKSEGTRALRCKEYYRERNIVRHELRKGFFTLRCHAGAVQIIFPVMASGVYRGLVSAGPFKGKDTSYADCRTRYNELPSGGDRSRIADVIKPFVHYLETHHAKSFPLRVGDPRIDRVCSALWSKGEKLSASKAAAIAGISVSRMLHLFTAVTGMTFSEYAIRARIDEAKQMLAVSEQSIGEIAEAVGYRQQSHFGVLFKRITGMTPHAYRNSVRNAAP